MWSLLIISGAMFGFALLHSLTAGIGLQARLRLLLDERFVEGWYRLAYNLVSGITFLPVLILVAFLPDRLIYHLPFPWVLLPLTLQVLAITGLAYSVRYTDGWRFLGLRQAWAYLVGASLPLPPESLQQRGLYALVRHPQYLFSLLFIWSTPILTLNWLTFNVVATLYLLIGSLIEERRLERSYGAAYRDYKRRVPWLLPCPRPRYPATEVP